MSEYRVAYTEVPATRTDDEMYGGLLVHIRPPVQLNPDAVEQFLTFGDLEPLNPADLGAPNKLDVKKAVLLGNTAEQTTIYASVDKSSRRVAEQVANDTVRLLQFMGAQAIIDNPPIPDA
jgi:hypothetical protein